MSILVTCRNYREKDAYLNLHDDMVRDIRFDRMEKRLCINLESFNLAYERDFCNRNHLVPREEYEIRFDGVVGFYMTSCDFFASDDRVFGIAFKEKEEFRIMPELIQKGETFNDEELKMTADKYMEIEILFISGDSLIIACQTMLFGKYEMRG